MTILTCYYRPHPGGFCRRLFAATSALLAGGHTVHYLSVVPFPIDHPRCVHHRFPWPAGRAEGLLFFAALHVLAPVLLLLLATRHRATHLFAFGHTYGLFLQPARVLLGRPLTVFLRADVLENYRLQGREWLIRLDAVLELLALRGAKVYCVSRALAERVRARCGQPVEVLPNALPEAPVRESLAISTSISQAMPGRPLRLCSVGTLEARKNQALLVEVMARAPGDLDLYGTGPAEAALQDAIARHGLGDRVRLRGWRDAGEIWPETDVLLFPSHHEGSPNAVLEALAAGVAILASDIPEHREILPTGLLPLTVDSWVEAVRAIAEPARLEQIRAEQQRAAAALRFDWPQAIRDAVLG